MILWWGELATQPQRGFFERNPEQTPKTPGFWSLAIYFFFNITLEQFEYLSR